MARKTRIRRIYKLHGGPDAPAEARKIAAQELTAIRSTEAVEDATLLLSEITAERLGLGTENDPGGAEREPRITIDVRQTAENAEWSVIDRGSPSLPAGLRSTALDEIATAWGVSRRAGLTRTWFELITRVRR